MSEGIQRSLGIQYPDIFRGRTKRVNDEGEILMSVMLRRVDDFWAELLSTVSKKTGVEYASLKALSVFEFFALLTIAKSK
jgi:hypothetical protein